MRREEVVATEERSTELVLDEVLNTLHVMVAPLDMLHIDAVAELDVHVFEPNIPIKFPLGVITLRHLVIDKLAVRIVECNVFQVLFVGILNILMKKKQSFVILPRILKNGQLTTLFPSPLAA